MPGRRADRGAILQCEAGERALAWVCSVPPAEADGALRLLLGYRSDVSRAAGRLDGKTEDCVLEAEERDRVVIDTSTRGKRSRS